MIQTHQQLIKICTEYNTLFSKNEFYPLQKAYSTPHFIVLALRFPGQNVALYLGRGHRYEGAFLAAKMPPSFLRVQDKLLDFIRKYLVGSRLGKMTLLSNGQAIKFSYKNFHDDNEFAIGYKEHHLFFVKREKDEIFTSWNNITSAGNSIDEMIEDFIGKNGESSDAKEIALFGVEKYLDEETKKISGKPIQKKKEKFLERKIKNIKHDLVLVSKWSEIEKMLFSEEEIDLPDYEVVLEGQKIKFASGINYWQKKDAIFFKVKKLKKAQVILEERLKEAELEFSKVQGGDFEFEVTKEKTIPVLWGKQAAKTAGLKNTSDSKIKEFEIKSIKGALGLDAQSNDQLRSLASKDHYWFHIENYPSAHCWLKTDDLSLLTGEDFSVIASMMRDLSKLEIMEIPMIYSQLKHVKGLKGVQGKVLIKKPKYLRCFYQSWKEIITLT